MRCSPGRPGSISTARLLEREGAASPAPWPSTGTEAGIEKQLRRLADLGVTELWPIIFPVGDDPGRSRARPGPCCGAWPDLLSHVAPGLTTDRLMMNRRAQSAGNPDALAEPARQVGPDGPSRWPRLNAPAAAIAATTPGRARVRRAASGGPPRCPRGRGVIHTDPEHVHGQGQADLKGEPVCSTALVANSVTTSAASAASSSSRHGAASRARNRGLPVSRGFREVLGGSARPPGPRPPAAAGPRTAVCRRGGSR